MKTILLLIFSLFSAPIFSQSVLPQGSSTQVVRYRGGMMLDSLFTLPIRNAAHPTGYVNTVPKGSILFDKNDSLIKYGNGIQFVALLTEPRAAALYFPTPAGGTQHYLNGLGNPVVFPVTQPPVIGSAITSDTVFQPNPTGVCSVAVQSSLSGSAGTTGTVIVAMSATQNGVYVDVIGPIRLFISGVSDETNTGGIPVPPGYWIRVTYSGTGTCSLGYTRWDL